MRHPATIILFMVCVSAVAAAMGASGAGSWLGVQPQPGISDQVTDNEKELRDFSASRSGGDTSFIGATIAGVDKTIASFVLVFALADMLINLGVPPWMAALFASPMAWAFGTFVLYMLTGRAEVRPR